MLTASHVEAALAQLVEFVSTQARAGASPVSTMLIAGGTAINWLDEWLRSQMVLDVADMTEAALVADDDGSALIRMIVSRHTDAVRAPHSPDAPSDLVAPGGNAGYVRCCVCHAWASQGRTGIWSCDTCGAYNETSHHTGRAALAYELVTDHRCSNCGLCVDGNKRKSYACPACKQGLH